MTVPIPNEYQAPTVTDITALIPRRQGKWRKQSAVIVTAVIVLNENTPAAEAGDMAALKRLKAAISKAYPFGERAMFPYKAWLDEVKEQLAALTGGKRPKAADDFRYRLVGGKPK